MELVIIAPLLFLIIKGGVNEAFPIENRAYSILWILILIIVLRYLVIWWLRINTVVETTTEKITISNPHKSTTLRWNDIFEFGRIRKYTFFRRFHWCFYVKGKETDGNRIIVATEEIQDIKALIAIIIRKSGNAKLVTIQYSSGVPIFSKRIITEWDRNEYLSEYLN